MPTERPVIAHARLIGACTLTSRVTGLVRDMLLAHAFALTGVLDAFWYAFVVPNLFRRLFGEGALAAAVVPTFTRTLDAEGRESAWRLLARTLALMTAALLAILLLAELIVLAVWLLAPSESEYRNLLLSLTALMLPFMLTICLLALFSSILNCVGSFVPAALMPMVLNLFMIAGVLWLGPALDRERQDIQVYGVALSVLVAGAVQILLILPVLRARGVRLGFRFELRDPQVRKLLAMMVPAMLAQGVLLFGVFLDANIAILLTRLTDALEAGAWSTVTYAQRLYQFPLAILAISLAVAALPKFSRLAAREDWPAWSSEVRGTLRMALFGGIPAGALMIVMAEPIVRLLFEYGKFDADDTARTAHVLRFYGLGLWAFCAQHIVLRAFFSTGDVKTPLRISCAVLPLNVALTLTLVWVDSLREAAFAVSTSISSALTVVVGIVLLQRRAHVAILDARTCRALAVMLAAALLSAVALAWLRSLWLAPLQALGGPVFVARAIDTLGGLALGCAFYALLTRLLRLEEIRLVLRRHRPPSS